MGGCWWVVTLHATSLQPMCLLSIDGQGRSRGLLPGEIRSLCQPAATQLGPQAVIRQDETERFGQRLGVQRIDQ